MAKGFQCDRCKRAFPGKPWRHVPKPIEAWRKQWSGDDAALCDRCGWALENALSDLWDGASPMHRYAVLKRLIYLGANPNHYKVTEEEREQKGRDLYLLQKEARGEGRFDDWDKQSREVKQDARRVASWVIAKFCARTLAQVKQEIEIAFAEKDGE